MGPTPELDTLRPALEALALCKSRELRERLLFEAVWGMGLAGALGLWRRVEAEGGLRQVLARGPADALPDAAAVEAVLAGTLAPELPGRRLVLCAPPGTRGDVELVLAFGELDAGEEALDFVEAILHLWTVVAVADPERDASDTLPSPTADTAALRSEGHRLAHDLRNLLLCITGNQELREFTGEDERPTLERRIDRDVGRAATLLGQAFGQPPRGGAPTHAALVREVCASERPVAAAAGVRLILEVAPGAAEGRADLGDLDLERVVRNLVVNARKAVATQPRAGRIEVHWTGDPASGYRLAVRDDGPGPPAELSLGFGLTSVRTLAEAAGGALTWRALPTGGAEFLVSVPPAGPPPRVRENP